MNEPPKKRGRPKKTSSPLKPPYQPTGRPKGRPRKNPPPPPIPQIQPPPIPPPPPIVRAPPQHYLPPTFRQKNREVVKSCGGSERTQESKFCRISKRAARMWNLHKDGVPNSLPRGFRGGYNDLVQYLFEHNQNY